LIAFVYEEKLFGCQLDSLKGKKGGKQKSDNPVSQTLYFGKDGYVVGVTAERASLARKLPSDVGAFYNVLNLNTIPNQIGQLNVTTDTFFVKTLRDNDSEQGKFEYDWESMPDWSSVQALEPGTLVDMVLLRVQCTEQFTNTTGEPYSSLYAKDTKSPFAVRVSLFGFPCN
jgi:hypothetical protein